MPQKKTNIIFYISAVIDVILGVGLDQYTKILAVNNLKGQESYVLIENVFSLHYLENRGAAFGMLQGHKPFFVISTLIVITLTILLMIKIPKTKRFMPLFILTPLIIAGALGNLIDRIRLGYVVDFFYFELIDFPVFNIADIFVTVSFAILVILILFYYKDEDFEFLSRKKNHPDTTGKEEEN